MNGKDKGSANENAVDDSSNELPNIAQLFDLFPYVMFYNRSVELDNKHLHEFKYSFPLGLEGDSTQDSELLAYFTAEKMELERLIVRANSLNITSPFTLYATQPVTEAKFTPEDMSFGVDCVRATNSEQDKLNYYVKRVFDLIMQTT